LLVLVTFLLFEGPAVAAAKVTNWVGSSSSDFTAPANWDNGVPGAGDTADVTSASAAHDPVVAAGTVSLGQLELDGGRTLTVSGGSLSVSGGMTIGNGSLDVTGSGMFVLSGDATSVAAGSPGGLIDVGAGATFEKIGTGDSDIDVPIDVAGTLLQTGAGGEIILAAPGSTDQISGTLRSVGGSIGLSGDANITYQLTGDATFDSHLGLISAYEPTTTLDLNGHTLSLNGDFDFQAGTLTGTGAIACATGADCGRSRLHFDPQPFENGGTLSDAGTLTIPPGTVVEQNNSLTISGTRVIDLQGTWDTTASLVDGGGSTYRLDVESDGILENLGTGTAIVTAPTDLDGTLINESNAGLELRGAVTDHIAGTIKSTIGNVILGDDQTTLQLTGDSTVDTSAGGTVELDSTSGLDLNGDSLNLNGSGFIFGTLTGSGTIARAPGVTSASARYASGSLGSNGTLTVASGVTISDQAGGPNPAASGTRTLVNDGTILLAGSLNGEDSTILINNGTIERTTAGGGPLLVDFGQMTNNGVVSADRGSITLIGTLTNDSGTTLSGGTYAASGGATLQIPSSAFPTTLAGGATVMLDGSGALTTAGASALVHIATIMRGSFLALTGGHAETTSNQLAIDGVLELAGGSKLTDAPGTTIGGTGTLFGTGTLAGNLTNAGTLLPVPGANPLTVAGNYTQTAAGRLEIPINGPASGQFASSRVTGTVALGGTVVVVPGTAYTASAQPGDHVAVLTYGGSRAGSFATETTTPPLSDGKVIALEYADASSQIDATVGLPPTARALPKIVGSAIDGHTLTATSGAWAGTPALYSYHWSRCDIAEERCLAVPASTASKHRLTSADIGHTLRATVTATNAYGAAEATANATNLVHPAPTDVRLLLNHPRVGAGRTVIVTIFNRLDTTISYKPCFALQQRVGNRWRTMGHGRSFSGNCPSHFTTQRPRSRLKKSIALISRLPSGRYRLTLTYHAPADNRRATAVAETRITVVKHD
jgi:hypothetical protein